MGTDYAGIAEAFRGAHRLILKHREYLICCALEKTGHPCNEQARFLITMRLQGHGLLSSWVRDHVLKGERPTFKEMRAYRLRWLRSLIKEFEGYAKEDSTND